MSRWRKVGPGSVVAAAFIGPGTVTTATLAGSNYGYVLVWAVFFSIITTYILQEMALRLGIIGRMGLGEAIRSKSTRIWARIVAVVLVTMAIFIGNAAYEAGNITGAVLGFPSENITFSGLSINPLVPLVGLLAGLILYFGSQKRITGVLMFLVAAMGIFFIASALVSKPDFGQIVSNLFVPKVPEGGLKTIMGLIGTTVVPYNLFLHSSFSKNKWTSESDLKYAQRDAFWSILFGGLITLAILICAAELRVSSDVPISNLNDFAVQLEPVLGSWAKWFMVFGFFCAGLSSAVTAPLAASFAVSEVMGWNKDEKSRAFRSIWITVLLVGVLFSSLGYKPITVILFAQIANGLVLPISAGFLFWIMNDKKLFGNHVNGPFRNMIGALVIVCTIALGLKAIWTAIM